MKKIAISTISILLFIVSCEEVERTAPRPDFDASDGFTVGVIRLSFTGTPEGDAIAVERREKGTQTWKYIGSCANPFFDDNNGYSQDDQVCGMPPKVFEYRARNSRYEYGDLQSRGGEEYSDIQEGFAYNILPVTAIEITSNVQSWDNRTINTLIWNENNNGSFLNSSEIFFEIYRSEDSLGTYSKVGQVGEDRSFTDELPASMLGAKVYYRIDVYYTYEIIMSSGGNHSESTTPIKGVIVASPNSSGDNPIIDYTTTEMGQLAQATQDGGIPKLLEKNIDGTLYLGLVNEAGATGYGIPELYKLNGTSWQKEWSINPPNKVKDMNYAIASSSQYLAGINDSVFVYEWNGSSWGNNLTPDNLGQAEAPSSVAVEVDNDNLYMAIKQHPNYELQVLKYNGSKWDTIGGNANGIIASGTIRDITLEKTGNKLYLHYLIDNTLHIKHLEGTSWLSDLSWSNDNVLAIDLITNNNEVYFTTETNNSAYLGGVYKVTSASTVDEIIVGSNATEESFRWPISITADSDDNLVVVSFRYSASTSSFYPHLNLYDGTAWKTVSGDFSDGIDPAIVSAIGTDLIYVYGDGASENGSGDPTIIKSKKLAQ